MKWRRLVGLLLPLGFVPLSYYFVYLRLIVPHLEEWNRVPVWIAIGVAAMSLFRSFGFAIRRPSNPFVVLITLSLLFSSVVAAAGTRLERVVVLEGHCSNGLHVAPRGPFAALVSCEDALGNYLTVIYARSMGAPADGPWRIGERFWHDSAWGGDVTSYAWGARGTTMYVATSGIYGSGSVYALDLARRHSRRLMPEGESGSRTEARFTITKFDEEAGRLEVVRKEEGRRKKMVIEVASQASRAGVRLLAGSGASPGDASTAAGSVTVIRPENNGGMNLIPCKLVLRRSTGLLSAAVTHVDGQRPAPIDDLKSLDLIGGDTLTLSVRPGKYSLSVVTPISEQPQGYRGKAHVWRSETLNVTVTKQGNVRVSILPTSAGPAYNGGWKIRQLSADETPSKARGQP